MKFSDKLAKLRKDKNFSQEQLAEKLNVSRQAVSKWESGISYPDMNKMLSICKVLDCKLDELMDDGVIPESDSIKNVKWDFVEYFKDFLNYITRIYNMFYSMSFKSKIKCILEMAFIAFILFGIGFITFIIMETFIFKFFYFFGYNRIVNFVSGIISFLVLIALFIVCALIFFHLFKIRYLDYYVTVEDHSVNEKTIEMSIDKSENKKIIIRDPKHSSQKFFQMIYKLLVLMLKCFILIISLPVLLAFLLGIVGITVGVYNGLVYNLLFIALSAAVAGACACIYVIVEMAYNFLFNLQQNFKKLFYVGISGVLVCGMGLGFAMIGFSSLKLKNENVKIIKKVDYFSDEEVKFSLSIPYKNIDFIVSDEDGIKVETSYPNDMNLIVNYDKESNNYSVFKDDSYGSGLEFYNMVLNELKHNKATFLNNSLNEVKVKIYASKDMIDKITDNIYY